jgi:hypothetical protein
MQMDLIDFVWFMGLWGLTWVLLGDLALLGVNDCFYVTYGWLSAANGGRHTPGAKAPFSDWRGGPRLKPWVTQKQRQMQ